MLKKNLPHYKPLAEFLFDSGAYLDPSELHGLLCGFISGGLSSPNAAWIELLLAGAQEERRSELKTCILTLFDISFQQLSSFGFDFEILLPIPEPEQDLLPLSALSKWSEQYMLGLSIAEALSRETKKINSNQSNKGLEEAKEDIQKVSRIYNQVLQCHEVFDEEAFTTLLEHVRIAAMLIFTELNGHIRPTQH